MKKNQFSEEQILNMLKLAEAGQKVGDICRTHGISDATFYRWKSKYSGMDASQLRRLQHLEEENRRLKHIVADLTLDNTALKDVLAKKW